MICNNCPGSFKDISIIDYISPDHKHTCLNLTLGLCLLIGQASLVANTITIFYIFYYIFINSDMLTPYEATQWIFS